MKPRLPLAVACVLTASACGGSGGGAPASKGGGQAPVAAVCGDGVVQGTEECDAGRSSADETCLATCLKPETWVTSDPHVHTIGCGGEATPEQLVSILENQQIQIGAALVWGDSYEKERRRFTGADHAASKPGTILHYDLEVSHFPAATGGHLVLLGLDSIRFSADPFAGPGTSVLVADWAHNQGPRALVGMAHAGFWPEQGYPTPPGSCCTPWELPVHAARGRLHFIGLENRRLGHPVEDGAFLLWKSIENSGFRVALTGSSDFPCIHYQMTGETPRTDVILEGAPSYDGWLDAIRRGRSTAVYGVGTRLDLRVNGTRLGGEIAVRNGQSVSCEVESRSGEPTDVEILVNGTPRAKVSLPAGHQAASVDLPLTASAWISARSPHALTSPVYALVDGKPIRASADDACYLARYVDHLTGLVERRELDMGAEAADAIAAYGEARRELAKRAEEAGGSCP